MAMLTGAAELKKCTDVVARVTPHQPWKHEAEAAGELTRATSSRVAVAHASGHRAVLGTEVPPPRAANRGSRARRLATSEDGRIIRVWGRVGDWEASSHAVECSAHAWASGCVSNACSTIPVCVYWLG